MSDGPTDFYRDLRWSGWEAEVEAVPLGKALSIYPPLFSAESAGGEVSRQAVPWVELAAFHEEMARQLAALSRDSVPAELDRLTSHQGPNLCA
jgi:hypothetical protein